MSQPRFFGQDNEINMQIGQDVITTLAIVSSEITYLIASKEVGILGETFDRVDEIYKGVSGTLEFQSGDIDALKVVDAIQKRARNRDPSVSGPRPKIFLKSQFTSPENGRKALIIVPDMKFADLPLNSSGREEPIQFRFQWRAEAAPISYL